MSNILLEAIRELRKVDEALFDFISDEALTELKKVKGGKLTHRKLGEGTIIDYTLDYDELNSDVNSSFLIFKVKFNDATHSLAYSFDPDMDFGYVFDDETKNILNNFWDHLQNSKVNSDENDKDEAVRQAAELATQHARDGFDVWYKYFTGRLKTRPTNPAIPIHLDVEAYVSAYKKAKQKQRHRKDVEELLREVSGTIEDTYSGDVKALVQWIKDCHTSIELSPSRNDLKGKENIQDIIDAIYDMTQDADIKQVKIGNSGGDLKNYQIHLKADALDTCPDLEAFLTWSALKFDFRKQEEKPALVYDKNQNDINSRRVVLDYLLNKEEYLNKE